MKRKRMKLSSDIIKKMLSAKVDCKIADMKRLSKSKTKQEIVRVFQCGSETYEVKTDGQDENIKSISKIKNQSSEVVKGIVKIKGAKKPFSNYLFAVSTSPDMVTPNVKMFAVDIVKKSFWAKERCSDDSPIPILKHLPDYLEDLNESSSVGAEVEDWMTVVKDLEALGLEYSNDIAQFHNNLDPDLKMYIKP